MLTNYYFASFIGCPDIAIFVEPCYRDAWVSGQDAFSCCDPIAAEERTRLTLDDVRNALYPLSDADIIDEITEAEPDIFDESICWISL